MYWKPRREGEVIRGISTGVDAPSPLKNAATDRGGGGEVVAFFFPLPLSIFTGGF